jgi:hypothetical protein
MGHTSVQRDHHSLCGAKKKNGELCRAFAGQGTDHFGVGRCKFHLGNTKTHNQNAVVKEAQRRAVKLGMPIEIAPHEALLMVLYIASGAVAWLREEVAALDDMSSFESRVLIELYGQERDRVAKIAKAALDTGVDARSIVSAEQWGSTVSAVLRRVFDDPALELSETQRAVLPEVVRRAIQAVERRPVYAPPPVSQLLGRA